jgi:hypothetical protein
MQTKLALLMDLPDGKVPGFYAQIIKALANKVMLFDRDKEMLIVSSEEERQSALEVMEHYKVGVEPMELLLLPEDARLTDAFSDYGFISRSEHIYLYHKLVNCFHLFEKELGSERDQALQQLEEHLIAEFNHQGEHVYAVDKQFEELAQGIAKAYRCELQMI